MVNTPQNCILIKISQILILHLLKYLAIRMFMPVARKEFVGLRGFLVLRGNLLRIFMS